jgi:hypothetical protein
MNEHGSLPQSSTPLESAAPLQEPAPSSPKPSMNAARWRWLRLAVGVCLLTWLALGIGLVAGLGFTPMVVLATLAAVSTEGLIWLTALLLGMNVYSARRHLWNRLRERLRFH